MVVKESKKISITSNYTEENKTTLENLLKENNIKFSIQHKKNRTSLYQKTILKWGLIPFTDNNLVKKLKYLIPKQYKELVCNGLGIKITKQRFIHYNYDEKPPKISYQFNKKFTPKYPIYVISHKRYNKKDCLTIKNLERMNLQYYLCIRENQEEHYRKFIEKQKYSGANILTIDIGDDIKGGTSQRNFCWKHSVSMGHKKFWLLDDNMDGWSYFNELNKVKINSPLCFTLLEDIIDNTKNVGIISHNYLGDVPKTDLRPPLQHNCKNYSSLLINTELLDKFNIKFRLLYNEDVDLTLQVLSNGINTLGTNIILVDKKQTGSCDGGNLEIYGDKKSIHNKFQDKFNCLYNTWISTPIRDCIKLVKHGKDKIPHHEVNYKKISKIYNLKEVKPIVKNNTLKTYSDYGIEMKTL